MRDISKKQAKQYTFCHSTQKKKTFWKLLRGEARKLPIKTNKKAPQMEQDEKDVPSGRLHARPLLVSDSPQRCSVEPNKQQIKYMEELKKSQNQRR